MMDYVIRERARLRVDQKTDHADVREEEEQWEPPPGIIQGKEEIKRKQDERKFFKFDQCFHDSHFRWGVANLANTLFKTSRQKHALRFAREECVDRHPAQADDEHESQPEGPGRLPDPQPGSHWQH